MVYFRITHEERFLLSHFSEDAACRPEVHAQRVLLLSQKDLGAPVPESDHLVGVGLDWKAKRTSQAEVSQFDCGAGRINQEVLGLEVSVENAVRVEVDEGLQDLVEEALGLGLGQSGSNVLQVLLEVEFEVLEDQVERGLRVEHFFQSMKK